MARVRFAFVDIDVAIFARESGSADAFVAVDQVVARTVIATGMRQAFVKFQIAIVTRESRSTVALIRSCFKFSLFELNSNEIKINRLNDTDGVLTDAVDARSEDGTLVDVLGTIAAGESRWARAGVVAYAVDTRATVLTRIGRCAVVDVLQTEMSGESERTATFVTVDQVETLFTVSTLNGEAFVDITFAKDSFETWWWRRKSFIIILK